MLAELGLSPAKPIAVIRTPPAVSLYHRFENDVLGGVLERLRGEQTVVLPRTQQQRAELAGREFIVPERAIDAQSLIAYADLVVSAGGTMNREAVALGTPVWTTFQGRLGAVDEQLIADGRLQGPRARGGRRAREAPAATRGQRSRAPRPGAARRLPRTAGLPNSVTRMPLAPTSDARAGSERRRRPRRRPIGRSEHPRRWYRRGMSKQIAVRLPDDLVAFVDAS